VQFFTIREVIKMSNLVEEVKEILHEMVGVIKGLDAQVQGLLTVVDSCEARISALELKEGLKPTLSAINYECDCGTANTDSSGRCEHGNKIKKGR
jgi:hypothetical protein